MAENYFVFGDEELLVQNKVRTLCDERGSKDIWAEEHLGSITDFLDKMYTQAMFSEQRIFIMEYGILESAKSYYQTIQQVLSGHGNILILYAKSKPDKRTQMFKLISQQAKLEEVTAPKGNELQRWITNRARELGAKSITSQAAAELMFRAGSNMLSLENELAKLIAYSPVVTVENVRLLAVKAFQISIFDLVDSVAQGSVARALGIVEELYRAGGAEPYILHMLARQYRLMFRFLYYRQTGYGNPEIQKTMPMHPYAFQKLSQQAGKVTLKSCAVSLHEIAAADYAFKSGQNRGLPLLQTLTTKLAKK